MNQTVELLPDFDAARIERYFQSDLDIIKEIFKVTSDNLGSDLEKLENGYKTKNFNDVKEAIHTVMPIFNILGLPDVEKTINNFNELCGKSTTVDELENDFENLWHQLTNAFNLINKQSSLFELQHGVNKKYFSN
jgi:hypothetical protein